MRHRAASHRQGRAHVERADHPRELGFGIALAPNALRALRALRELGVAESLLPLTTQPAAVEFRRLNGRLIRRFDLANLTPDGGAILPRIILRSTLHRALQESLGADAVCTGHEVVSCETDDECATVRFANGSTASADIVIGADGIHSSVRASLYPKESAQRPSGYFALRGASSAVDVLPDQQGIIYYGRGIECGVVRASQDRVYWFFSLLAADVHAAGGDAAELLRKWLPHCDRRIQMLADTTSPDDLRLDNLLIRPVLARWGTRRVTLLASGSGWHPRAIRDSRQTARPPGRGSTVIRIGGALHQRALTRIRLLSGVHAPPPKPS